MSHSHLRSPQYGGSRRTAPPDPTSTNLADVIGRAESLYHDMDEQGFAFEASLMVEVVRNLSGRK
jgi:hypothetical protein